MLIPRIWPLYFLISVRRTGLPPSLTDPYDSDSDSEAEDEADEDSNGLCNFLSYWRSWVDTSVAEEYYKNDYPDEEELSDWSGSSGMFGDASFA